MSTTKLTALAFLGSILWLQGCSEHRPTSRVLDVDGLEFHVTGPYKIRSRVYKPTHTYKLEPEEVLRGLTFGSHDAMNRDQGADRKLSYLPADKLAVFENEYRKKNVECPASFFHMNQRHWVLFGATKALTKRLEQFNVPFSQDGAPFALRGHRMTYKASKFEDGSDGQLVPLQFETAHSNVGTTRIEYDFFLVTGFEA